MRYRKTFGSLIFILFIPADAMISSATTRNNSANQGDLPKLIMLPGTAQSITSWSNHVLALERQHGRKVLFVDTLASNSQTDTTDISLPAQAEHVYETICALHGADVKDEVFDLVGFSLGGRIAMAFALKYPERVRKLFLTGVALNRSAYGNLLLMSWKDNLRSGNLRGFGWAAILSSYSREFLEKNEARIEEWLNGLCSKYDAPLLLQQMEQTQPFNADPWSVEKMSLRMARETNIEGKLCVGSLDLLAPREEVEALGRRLGWDVAVIQHCGHSVAVENPSSWRLVLEDFLSS